MNNWISVKERLPELVNDRSSRFFVDRRSDPVYVTTKWENKRQVLPIPCILHSNGNWYIDDDSLKEWVNLNDYNDGTDDPLKVEVIAWRPMMEPYNDDSSSNIVSLS